MWIKIAIVVMLFFIVISLFSALFFLSKDKGTGDRTVKALTIRISLSIALFIMILIAYRLGYLGQQ